MYAQKKASEKVFKKKISHLEVLKLKREMKKTLGELFSFFILETILLGKALKYKSL